MTRPIAIDLFSGCGGLSEGLRQAGFRVAIAVEIDELAAETYARNHPQTIVLRRDVRDVNPKQILASLPKADRDVGILAACAPCQGFSRLSTLNRPPATSDPRNELLLSVLPFIEKLKPRAIMLENVPEAQKSRQMKAVRASLLDNGYQFSEAVLNVADYGVPQNRRRYILIGARNKLPGFPKRLGSRLTVRQAIAHLPASGTSGDPLHDVTARRLRRIEELIACIPHDGGSRDALPVEYQLRCHGKSSGFSDVYGRMVWDKPSPTITSGFVSPSKGRFLHPEENRTITLREAALLQGFPSDYYFSMRRGKYSAAEMIGNAVPPEFAKRQAEILKRLS